MLRCHPSPSVVIVPEPEPVFPPEGVEVDDVDELAFPPGLDGVLVVPPLEGADEPELPPPELDGGEVTGVDVVVDWLLEAV